MGVLYKSSLNYIPQESKKKFIPKAPPEPRKLANSKTHNNSFKVTPKVREGHVQFQYLISYYSRNLLMKCKHVLIFHTNKKLLVDSGVQIFVCGVFYLGQGSILFYSCLKGVQKLGVILTEKPIDQKTTHYSQG
jgi:hypothetical protein